MPSLSINSLSTKFSSESLCGDDWMFSGDLGMDNTSGLINQLIWNLPERNHTLHCTQGYVESKTFSIFIWLSCSVADTYFYWI